MAKNIIVCSHRPGGGGVGDLFSNVSLVQGIDHVESVEVILCRLTRSFPGGTVIHRLEAPLLAGRKVSDG
jgi:hypothetical protein